MRQVAFIALAAAEISSGTLRTELLAGRREMLNSPKARIGGIIVTKARASGADWDLFEMFIDRTFGEGRFPDSLKGMTVRCSYTCSGATCTASNMRFDSTESPNSPARGEAMHFMSMRTKKCSNHDG